MTLPEEVRKLHALVDAVATPDDQMVRIYLIHPTGKPWELGAVCRAGGPPIGVDPDTRPRAAGGGYKQHLLTVDLDAAPAARAAAKLDGVRALALFIDDAASNDAFLEDNTETAVLLLSDADFARGEWTGEAVDDPPAQGFELHPVDVPTRAFEDNDDFYFNEDATGVKELLALHNELMSAERVGGALISFGDNERTDGFLLQFSEFVVDVNLGDAGTMYVFPDGAYWGGH
jgi:hypothetical protein